MISQQHPSGRFAPPAEEMAAIVRGLYLSLLGREPDAPGLAHWVRTWQDGADLASIAANLLASGEYASSGAAARRNASTAAAAAQQAALEAGPALAGSPVVVVDVGAQNLLNEEHVYAALGRHAVPHRIIGFEPLEHRRHERMEQAAGGLTLLPAFIGDGGEHIFHVNDPDATSSLLPFNRDVTDRLLELAPLRTVATEAAATQTLDAALAQESHVDLLKLDIQGFELTALRHATSVLQRTLVVHCEVSFAEIYLGQALFSDVERYMRCAGFDLVDLPTLCRYPLTETPYAASRDWLGWGDAVFFRRLGDDATWRERLVQSVIALTVYRKPSLASWLARQLAGTPAAGYQHALDARGAGPA